jgi:glycosyltransferase involved in cell wall biosynthesis
MLYNSTKGSSQSFLSEPLQISEQEWGDNIVPFVSISCITYNHEKYIRNAIEGFLMQKTTFPVEILVHDDASSDGTTSILREYEEKYPSLIKSIYQTENQYSQGIKIAYAYQYPRMQGKYYAICEGDDYWIEPLKLQKQVDFLENNTDCSMVFTGCRIEKSTGEIRQVEYKGLGKIDANQYVNNSYYMATASLLIHKKFLQIPNEDWMKKSFAGDFVLRYKALSIGCIGYINLITCVYNKGTEGSWSNRKLSKNIIIKEYSDNIRGLYFIDKHRPISKIVKTSKIDALRVIVYFKMALMKSGWSGLFYLLGNIRKISFFHIGAYIKRMFK